MTTSTSIEKEPVKPLVDPTPLTKAETFTVAFLFCLPSQFRLNIEAKIKATIKDFPSFEAAMLVEIWSLMRNSQPPAQNTQFPNLNVLWDDNAKNFSTGDPRAVSTAFVPDYTNPPCPRPPSSPPDQQTPIIAALGQANVPK
jgi:hypothetical protein